MDFTILLREFVFVLALIVLFGFLNEKVFKLTNEIALMLISFVVGLIFYITHILTGFDANFYIEQLSLSPLNFDLNNFLVQGILCFMLFAGACRLKWNDLLKNFKLTAFLSLLTTLVTAVIYGSLFYLVSLLIGLDVNFILCLLLGSIISPTDPIAATSILRKFGLPKNTSLVIEGESLFNDGVGVALFITVLGLATNTSESNFFFVMFRELFGAIAIGLVISFLLFKIFIKTDDKFRQIAVSLLTVSASYALCEFFECSGAIASVVCGIYFATKMHTLKKRTHEKYYTYYDFWEVIDNLLNSILYVILGYSFIFVTHLAPLTFAIIGISAIIINLIARALGVSASVLFCRPLPDGYKPVSFVTLLTWGGLKGGLSFALALGTQGLIPDNTYYIFLCATYFVVFFTTIVQGLTVKSVYNRLEKNRGRA